MSGWQRAGEIPGLFSGGSGAAVDAATGRPAADGAGGGYGGGGYSGGPLSIDFGILEFIWRSLVLVIGSCLIIPAPWVLVWYSQWIVPCVQVPGRPNLSFTGSAMTIVPWFFGLHRALRSPSASPALIVLNNLMCHCSDRSLLAVPEMVRRESRVQRAAARAQLLRFGLGLSRLDILAVHLHLHDHRLGLG